MLHGGQRKGKVFHTVFRSEPCEMRKVAGQVVRDKRGLSGEAGQMLVPLSICLKGKEKEGCKTRT